MNTSRPFLYNAFCVWLTAAFALLLCSCNSDNGSKNENTEKRISSICIEIDKSEWEFICNDRSYTANVNVQIVDKDGFVEYEGTAGLKTRGNSTWNADKKPFTLKLPQKEVLFGLERGKNYTLLANNYDESFIRNALAFEISRCIGLPAPYYEYVSLYVNDEYRGLYQMVNKVDVGVDGVNIVNLNKRNRIANGDKLKVYSPFSVGDTCGISQRKGVNLEFDPDDITGGYLLDVMDFSDSYLRSSSGFVSDSGSKVSLKSPEHASEKEVDYISNAFSRMETALMNPFGNNPIAGKHYTEYLDVESFALYYLVQELVMNADAGLCSFYIYKDTDSIDGRFYAGPVWDFDYSLNTPLWQGLWFCEYEMFAEAHTRYGKGGLLYCLCRQDDFRARVRGLYNSKVRALDSLIQSSYMDSLFVLLEDEAERDYKLFPDNRQSDSYVEAVERVRGFISKRVEFLKWLWSTNEKDIVCVKCEIKSELPFLVFERMVGFYAPKNEGVRLPDFAFYRPTSLDAKSPRWYYSGTNRRVGKRERFRENQQVELRWENPTKYEKVVRRYKRALGLLK